MFKVIACDKRGYFVMDFVWDRITFFGRYFRSIITLEICHRVLKVVVEC